MQFDINIVSEVSSEKWKDFLDNSLNVSPFHLESWMKVSSITYGYKPLYLIATRSDGTIIAGMPFIERRSSKGLLIGYYSLPDGSYGSVIIRQDSDPGLIKKILIHFSEFQNRWNVNKSIIVDFNNSGSYLSTLGFKSREAFSHIIDLNQPLNEIHRKYDYSIRKNIEKAKRNGIIIRTIDSIEEVEEYYKITHSASSKHNRAPYPKELFINIFRLMVPLGEAKFSLTFKGEQLLSGALHLISNKHIFNWLMPSFPEFLEYRPNEALISYMIDWAVENNFELYNLGGSPSDATGLIKFKEKWGTKMHVYKVYESGSASNFLKIFDAINYLRLKIKK